MVYHEWGEEDFDWKGLDDAGRYLSSYCRKYGRLGVHTKEKYGSLRAYVMNLGSISLHDIFYPGFAYNQMPKWLWNLDCDYIGPTLRFLFGRLVYKWHIFIYNRAYQTTMQKWPHLRAEILSDADYIEFIEGVTRIEVTPTERLTHILGWNGETITTWHTDL